MQRAERGDGAGIAWSRRETEQDSIYLVSNQSGRSVKRTLIFRQAQRTPEIWDPLDGSMERAISQRTADGRTAIEISLEVGQCLFVVFREQPTAPSVTREPAGDPILLNSPWTVTFEKNLGAPDSITLEKLVSLSTHSEPGVKYFSGIARYLTTVNVPQEWIDNSKTILLDLGDVHHIARVSVNGKQVADLWCPPYRASLSATAFRPGANELILEVAIPWANRLIGDEELPPEAPRTDRGMYTEIPEWVKTGGKSPKGRVTFVTVTTKGATKGTPLYLSGLLGPVSLTPIRIVIRE